MLKIIFAFISMSAISMANAFAMQPASADLVDSAPMGTIETIFVTIIAIGFIAFQFAINWDKIQDFIAKRKNNENK